MIFRTNERNNTNPATFQGCFSCVGFLGRQAHHLPKEGPHWAIQGSRNILGVDGQPQTLAYALFPTPSLQKRTMSYCGVFFLYFPRAQFAGWQSRDFQFWDCSVRLFEECSPSSSIFTSPLFVNIFNLHLVSSRETPALLFCCGCDPEKHIKFYQELFPRHISHLCSLDNDLFTFSIIYLYSF